MRDQVPSNKISLYFFGDSICFGQFISPHEIWTTSVSKAISEKLVGSKFEVVTQVTAVNGEITREALSRLQHCVTSHAPEIVWVQFGLNDANYWETDQGLPRTAPESFRANMKEIIERILACRSKKVLVATNHVVTKTPAHLNSDEYQTNARKYNLAIRDLVSEFNNLNRVELVDIEMLLGHQITEPKSILLEDGVHLNRLGHQLYFATVFPMIDNAISQLIN